MKKRNVMRMMALVMATTLLAGCGKSDENALFGTQSSRDQQNGGQTQDGPAQQKEVTQGQEADTSSEMVVTEEMDGYYAYDDCEMMIPYESDYQTYGEEYGEIIENGFLSASDNRFPLFPQMWIRLPTAMSEECCWTAMSLNGFRRTVYDWKR